MHTTDRTPAEHRAALAAWRANAPANDSDLLPRAARVTSSPRHASLAGHLKSLLAWRAISQPIDPIGNSWLSAANDNDQPDDDEEGPALLDSEYEIRPRLGEIKREIKKAKTRTFRHALYSIPGGGADEIVIVGGDVEFGNVANGPRRAAPSRCVTRIGDLRFSNGLVEEPCLVLAEDKVVHGSVVIPVGGMTHYRHGRTRDRFGRAKRTITPGIAEAPAKVSGRPMGEPMVDRIAEAEFAQSVRTALPQQVVDILDLAIEAANFSDVGRHLGYVGKTAERKGRQAVIDACAALEAVLTAA